MFYLLTTTGYSVKKNHVLQRMQTLLNKGIKSKVFPDILCLTLILEILTHNVIHDAATLMPPQFLLPCL